MKHNPDNLTDEQIGVADGWRLLAKDEVELTSHHRLYAIECWSANRWLDGGYYGHGTGNTYRTRLTRAELRKARGLEPEGVSSANFPPSHATDPRGDKPMEGTPTQQPAEAVSEAAREAASELQSRARYEEDLLTDGEVKQIIQRAITAATAAQQAELAALREEVERLGDLRREVARRLNDAGVHGQPDEMGGPIVETLRISLLVNERDALRAELATTRERLAKCEASFETIRDRVSDVINRIEHDLTGDLDGDVAFEFDELLELLTKALAAQPLDGGAK